MAVALAGALALGAALTTLEAALGVADVGALAGVDAEGFTEVAGVVDLAADGSATGVSPQATSASAATGTASCARNTIPKREALDAATGLASTLTASPPPQNGHVRSVSRTWRSHWAQRRRFMRVRLTNE